MMYSPSTAATDHAEDPPEIIGLIPSAGQATRISPLPCSKEIFPLGLAPRDGASEVRPKVACHYLLEKMRKAGAKKGSIILRHGKWDIPGYCGDGEFVDMNLAYLMMGAPFGPPYSIDQAFPFVKHARIVFGFPDILFEPDDAFIKLLDKHRISQADAVLALFPAHDSRHMDMVQIDSNGKVVDMFLKPLQSELHWAWVCAVWSSSFTKFLHLYLQDTSILLNTHPQTSERSGSSGVPAYELSIGHVLQAGLRHGLDIQAVTFAKGIYCDIGTPHGLSSALRTVLAQNASSG